LLPLIMGWDSSTISSGWTGAPARAGAEKNKKNAARLLAQV